MFFFVNFEGKSDSEAYDKGLLFEDLVKELVAGLGYRDVKTRAKVAGKEYDITAKAKVGNIPLIGQAKALVKTIPAGTISEFVGSMELKDFPENAIGIFVSITDLSPDAHDWLNNVRESKRTRIVLIIGNQIFDRLTEIGYPSKKRSNVVPNSYFNINLEILIF
jgi:hypothetical protein